MIVDGLLNLFHAMFAPIVDLLPEGDFPIDAPTSSFGAVNYVARLDYLVPVLGPLQFLIAAVGATFAGLLAYRIGVFLYTKVRG